MLDLDMALTNEQVKAFQPVLKRFRNHLVEQMGAEGLTPQIEDQITKSLPVLSKLERALDEHMTVLTDG